MSVSTTPCQNDASNTVSSGVMIPQWLQSLQKRARMTGVIGPNVRQ